MSVFKSCVAAVAIALISAASSVAGTISLVTDRSLLPSDDLIKWSALPGAGDLVEPGNPVATTSVNGVSADVSGNLLTLFLGSTFNADFDAVELVLATTDASGDPGDVADPSNLPFIRIMFGRALYGAGAAIQGYGIGDFVGEILALGNGGSTIASKSFSGTTGQSGGGAPFFGIASDDQEIFGIEFRLNDDGGAPQAFAINDVSLSVPDAGATSGLLFLASALLGVSRRRVAR